MRAIAILAICLALTCAFAAKKSVVGNKLRGNDLIDKIAQDEFGKKLLDTVFLQLRNKSPLTDVSELINNIRIDVENDQREADSVHAEQEAECEQSLGDYDDRIAFATSEINEAAFAIQGLQERVATLSDDIEIKGSQISLLAEEDQNVRESRTDDAADYAARVGQTNEVIAALDLIIPRLQSLQANDDVEGALIELGKIGKKNPISALVQIAASLDADALLLVIQKLETLRESLSQSLVDDEASEAEAVSNYNAFLNQLDSVRTNLENARAASQEEFAEAGASLTEQESRLDSNREELDNATDGRALKQTQCDNWDVEFQAASNRRNANLEVIRQILNILATKLDTLDAYVRYD